MHKSQKAWNIQFLCFGIKATDAFFRYLYPAFTSFVLIFFRLWHVFYVFHFDEIFLVQVFILAILFHFYVDKWLGDKI